MAMASSTLPSRCGFFGVQLPQQHQRCRVSAPSTLVVRAGAIGPGKKWEHYKLTANGKPEKVAMHVRSGDTVKVISGADKGKVGKITKKGKTSEQILTVHDGTQILTKTGEVFVEGVNIKTKHVKPTQQGESGQIVKKEFPVHHSNVQCYSTAQQVVSRVGYKINEDGKKVRYLLKTNEVIDTR